MRLFIVLILFCIPATAYAGRVLVIPPELATTLTQWEHDPFIGDDATQLQQRLAELDKMLIQAEATATGLHIDIVLQAHDALGASPSDMAEVLQSQKQIRSILDKGNYVLVSLENIAANPLTQDRWIEMLQYEARTVYHQSLSRQQALQIMDQNREKNAGLAYMFDHQDRHVIGCEDKPLNAFHELAINQYHLRPAQRRELDHLCDQLGRLRSTVCLAQTILAARQYHAGTSVMIIGSNHGSHFPPLIKGLGITSQTISTVK